MAVLITAWKCVSIRVVTKGWFKEFTSEFEELCIDLNKFYQTTWAVALQRNHYTTHLKENEEMVLPDSGSKKKWPSDINGNYRI